MSGSSLLPGLQASDPAAPEVVTPYIRMVHLAGARVGEGAVWWQDRLWWVDIPAGTISWLNLERLEPEALSRRSVGDLATGMVPSEDGRWLVLRRGDAVFFDWENDRSVPALFPLLPAELGQRYNDGKCDRAGRLITGTMMADGSSGNCRLLSVDRGQVRILREGVGQSNGIGWTPEGDRMYHVDTASRRIDVYRYNQRTGSISDERVFADLQDEKGVPDGLAVDVEGHVWVALWGGGCVVQLDRATGEVLERLSLPASQVSSCAFGGPHLRTLFITTASEGLGPDWRLREPMAGAVFAMETGTEGLPADAYRLE